MLTVLIECRAEAGPLVVSLAALVPGAVEGLVREVVVLDAGLDAAAREVADHAGCRVAPVAEIRPVVAGAKGGWLLLLEPGARLDPEWIGAVSRHVMDAGQGVTPRAARFSRSPRDRPGFFARLARRPSALADGLLLPKAQAIGLAASAPSLAAMAKGLATRRLDAAIRPRETEP